MARSRFRWRYRLGHIEGTAKLSRALHLLRLEGSEEFLDVLGFTAGELEALAEGERSLEETLERARRRQARGDLAEDDQDDGRSIRRDTKKPPSEGGLA